MFPPVQNNKVSDDYSVSSSSEIPLPTPDYDSDIEIIQENIIKKVPSKKRKRQKLKATKSSGLKTNNVESNDAYLAINGTKIPITSLLENPEFRKHLDPYLKNRLVSKNSDESSLTKIHTTRKKKKKLTEISTSLTLENNINMNKAKDNSLSDCPDVEITDSSAAAEKSKGTPIVQSDDWFYLNMANKLQEDLKLSKEPTITQDKILQRPLPNDLVNEIDGPFITRREMELLIQTAPVIENDLTSFDSSLEGPVSAPGSDVEMDIDDIPVESVNCNATSEECSPTPIIETNFTEKEELESETKLPLLVPKTIKPLRSHAFNERRKKFKRRNLHLSHRKNKRIINNSTKKSSAKTRFFPTYVENSEEKISNRRSSRAAAQSSTGTTEAVKKIKRYFKCLKCDKKYERVRHFILHRGKCNQPNTCSLCPYKTHNEEDFKKHITDHILGIPVEDMNTDYKNDSKSDRMVVVKTLVQRKQYRLFNTRRKVKRRKLPCSSEYLKAKCSKCYRNAKARINCFICKMCRAKLVYQCALCNQEFSKYSRLRQHIVIGLHVYNNENCKKCSASSFRSLCELQHHEENCLGISKPILNMNRPLVIKLQRCDELVKRMKETPSTSTDDGNNTKNSKRENVKKNPKKSESPPEIFSYNTIDSHNTDDKVSSSNLTAIEEIILPVIDHFESENENQSKKNITIKKESSNNDVHDKVFINSEIFNVDKYLKMTNNVSEKVITEKCVTSGRHLLENLLQPLQCKKDLDLDDKINNIITSDCNGSNELELSKNSKNPNVDPTEVKTGIKVIVKYCSECQAANAPFIKICIECKNKQFHFQCNICEKILKNHSEYLSHLFESCSRSIKICNLCGYSDPNNKPLQNHVCRWDQLIAEKSLDRINGVVEESELTMEEIRNIIKDKLVVSCPKCNLIRPNSMRNFSPCKNCDTEIVFLCKYCRKEFESYENAHEHILLEELKIEDYYESCPTCDREFETYKSMAGHMKTCAKKTLFHVTNVHSRLMTNHQ
ncbi:RE1-silencing transcription factor A-like isoform X1 [Trichogramma pretiosum]|uniref:RE1-silencing transcription factor A-like isoform X1 n=1 Tax=Trichogramma pretiosum TaxID=7493 RepID=UPI0006C9E58E|nr:RE1-silencing transcription factor A-like isoform X1 [Trichogramma pretiosum]XP_023317958.1 RE1-silencing transcription factor A-like isoform X1 [Trichogramma pretiosum]